VGPARSAILLFAGEYGGVRIAVGLRSVETGTVAHFAYAGSSDDFETPDRAMDAALTFAEALGFLFDDDVVGASGRGEALRIWHDLTGETHDAPYSDSEADFELELDAELGDDEGDGELLLDDEAGDLPPPNDGAVLVELDVLPEEPVAAAPTPPRRERPAPAPKPSAATLTKFRQAASSSAETSASGPDKTGGNHLGRIALVRRRVNNDSSGAERPGILMRILSAF
jgi:hypothetical protein